MSAPGASARGTLRTVLAVAMAAVLAAGAVIWMRSLHWPIEVVRIDGQTRYVDTEELRGIVVRHARQGFFGIDLSALRADISDLPWVRRAALRRVWPDTLHVDVREHRPVARWNDDALVSDRGVVFRPATIEPDDLPALFGPPGQAAGMLATHARYESMLASLGLRIRMLRQDTRRSWQIELDEGPVLRLGREAVDERLERLIAVWPLALADRQARLRSVDLRYTNGFAVAWREESPGADSPEGEV